MLNEYVDKKKMTPFSEIFIKVGNHYKRIDLDDINYFFYENRHANIIVDNITYPLNMSMKHLADFLPEHRFLQVHQSFIINIRKIEKICLSENMIVVAGENIPIGVRHKKRIQQVLPILL